MSKFEELTTALLKARDGLHERHPDVNFYVVVWGFNEVCIMFVKDAKRGSIGVLFKDNENWNVQVRVNEAVDAIELFIDEFRTVATPPPTNLPLPVRPLC